MGITAVERAGAGSLRQAIRSLPPDYPEMLRVRLHRAASWLARAESEQDDDDAAFVFLWIVSPTPHSACPSSPEHAELVLDGAHEAPEAAAEQALTLLL